MAVKTSPPNYDQLLPLVLENRARSNPHGAWAKFPNSDQTYTSGLRTATNLNVYNAVNKVAWLLEESLGPAKNFETIAYIGPNDLRYFIVVLAGIRVGYKTFLPSPRNSKVAHIHLLSRLECTKLVTTDPEPACVPVILGDYKMQKLVIPGIRELLDYQDVPLYPYNKSYETSKNEPIFVLHTSGSTGIPKPLIYTHRYVTRIANATALPAPDGFVSGNKNLRSGSWFTLLAPFHISGIGFGLMVAAFNECVPIFPLPGKPLATEEFLEAVRNVDMDWAFVLPVTLEDLSKDPPALDLVSKKLKHIYFAGGSVPQAAGDLVSSKIPIYQTTGSSEAGILSLIRSRYFEDPTNWGYIQIHPALNIELRHQYGDLHELVIVKSKENEECQPIFTHFPELDEYPTRDLLSPHPNCPGLWKHRGRKDDIIVFLNGEKTNPLSFEQEISRHPEVRSALVAGDQRFEACLLIEPTKMESISAAEAAQIIQRIWPTVQKANSQCPAHARVSKSNIIFTDPSKPMPRAAKGTVQRAATLILYAEEINRLYDEKELSDLSNSGLSTIELSNPDLVAAKIYELVAEVTQWESFENEKDFFSMGMDSLQDLQLSRLLKHKDASVPLTPSVIYKNPSVDLLTQVISPTSVSNGVHKDRSEYMAKMLHTYEKEIDSIYDRRLNKTTFSGNGGDVIALTGSTGAVGSYILHELLQKDHVSHVYCLNRAQDSQSLQVSRNGDRRIPINFPPERVTFLTVDLTKDTFGLEKEVFHRLLLTTTQIIHNAWPVNFNQALQSFKPSLDGVLGLINFAEKAKLSPSILFLSSISTVSNYHQIRNGDKIVPERIISEFESPAYMGYGESKYMAERILDYAARRLDLKTGIARVGQIAGTAQDPHGWNRNEWLPSLVISSRYLNAIPESLGSFGDKSSEGMLDHIDWVPIDQLASVLVELSFNLFEQPHIAESRVYHPINPKIVHWKHLVPTVIKALQESTSDNTKSLEMRGVSYNEWLERLGSSAASITEESNMAADVLRQNPAVKLLEFYQSLVIDGNDQLPKQLAIDNTLTASLSLQNLEAIKPEWLRGWIGDWVLS